MGGARTVRAPAFRIGQKVEVSLCGGDWQPATVVEVGGSTSYPITVAHATGVQVPYATSEVRPLIEATPPRKRQKKT